jgi:tetratricopeptide (TPR) repeat protein
MRLSITALGLGIALGWTGCVVGARVGANGAAFSSSPMDAGFHRLYELRFADARSEFSTWEKVQPNDAMGPVGEAASYLFEELNAQGVLSAEYFMDDARLLGGKPLQPDPVLRAAFEGALDRAQKSATARLHDNPQDENALFALAMAMGMRADYESIIEKKQLASLGLIKDADATAKKLLAIDPSRADADLSVGTAEYIIGCLPAYKRYLLLFGGIHGNRAGGMDLLRVTAENGHYLRPYGKLMLGLAALREKQTDLARNEFQQLVSEFPGNPLFKRELAKLN